MTRKHDIIWFDVLDSTNDEAARQIRVLDNLSVLSAVSQISGRGQRGNTWSSEPGENLTFSIVLKFNCDTDDSNATLPYLAASEQFAISEVAALSVIGLLRKHGIDARIKWPNDIYAGDCKICGMLIENSIRGKMLSSSIAGIGLNVNQSAFDSSLPNPTSMYILTGQRFTTKTLLHEFMDVFMTEYNRLTERQISTLRNDYLKHLWRIDTPAGFQDYTSLPSGHSVHPIVTGCLHEKGEEFTGIIRGLSPIGHLIVEDIESGVMKEFSFKEIGYIL